jgi:hypothetical protein
MRNFRGKKKKAELPSHVFQLVLGKRGCCSYDSSWEEMRQGGKGESYRRSFHYPSV